MGDIVPLISASADQRPKYPPCNFHRLEKLALRDVYSEYGSWASNKTKRDRRIKRWRQKRFWSKRMEDFALSRPMLDSDADLLWECTEILGQGSFGVVGLWRQLDRQGRAIDSVAIKEIDNNDSLQMAKCRGYEIPMEAKVMHEFRNSWSVPQLRHLIYLESSKARWRMYQEYCSHGDMRSMVKLYQEYNHLNPEAEQQIPEPYIWFVFFSFAKALVTMENPDFNDIKDKYQPGGRQFVIHLDFKDSNVLLTDPFTAKPLSGYPVVKVCDWGMAQFTGDKDPWNSRKFKSCGTKVWDPPEQKHENRLCDKWRNNPYGHHRNYDAPYSIAQPLWQMAAVVFGLVTLDRDNEFLSEVLNDIQHKEHELRQDGMVLIDMNPQLQDEYSQELFYLIMECLNVDPKRRPSPTSVLQRTKDGLRRAARKYEERGSRPSPVFYGDNGLERMLEHFRLWERIRGRR